MSKYRKEINSILKDLQRGEIDKQQLLYDKTVNFLKIIALKYATDKNDYEDILTEAYFRVFRYIESFDSSKDGYNWLCRIVQNVAKDFNGRVIISIPLEEVTFTDILGADLDRVIERDDLIAKVCKLTKSEQNLIYLRFYEDLTYTEIARLLHSKKSTVHKQISIILKKLSE